MLLIFVVVFIMYLMKEYLKSIDASSVSDTLKKRNKQITKWLS